MNCRIFSEAYKLLLVYPFFHWCFGKKEISIQKSKIDHIFDNAMLCVKFVERKWWYKIQCKYICAPGRPRWLPWYYNIINNTICYITALHIYMHISPCLYYGKTAPHIVTSPPTTIFKYIKTVCVGRYVKRSYLIFWNHGEYRNISMFE